jgi:acetolactate synthase I/II/III large subunit
VALECAIDIWGQATEASLAAPIAHASPCADPAAIAAAVALLAKARRPLIVVGGGALDAGPEVQAAAELLHAPVSSFRRGRGVIPTSHALAVSFTEGHSLWKTADAVLAVGTRLLLAAEQLGGWTTTCRSSASISTGRDRPVQ